jgi:FtsH-binding integral membrane protein
MDEITQAHPKSDRKKFLWGTDHGTDHDFGGNSGFEQSWNNEKVCECAKEVRLGFLRKVYGILSVQLIATAIVCILALTVTVHRGTPAPGGWNILALGSFLAGSQAFYWSIFVFSLLTLFALMAFKNRHPLNMQLLLLWTVMMAFSVATACVMVTCDPLVVDAKGGEAKPLSQWPPGASLGLAGGELQCAIGTPYANKGIESVLMAVGITAAVFVSLTVFTFQSKIDFSFLGAGLFVVLLIFIFFGLGMAIFGASPQLQYFYALAGTIIFSLYIVFDTWLISAKLGPDEYIFAAITLYLDIINLFVYVLQLVARRD